MMKFNKDDIGVIVEGVSLYNSVEQSFKILQFAARYGLDIDENELGHAILDYETDSDVPMDFYDDLGYAVEEAIHYLNTECCEKGVAFTFRDTDFVLIGQNGLDKTPSDKVE